MEKRICYLAILTIGLSYLNAQSHDSIEPQTVQYDRRTFEEEEVLEEEEEEDFWFGPGFYYGIWFDNEPAYWEWRHDHSDYPSNRYYYNHDHPVYYHHEEHGEERSLHEDHDRGGGGKHGGRK